MYKKIALLSVIYLGAVFGAIIEEQTVEAPRSSTNESLESIITTYKFPSYPQGFLVKEEVNDSFYRFEESLDRQKTPFILATLSNAGSVLTTEKDTFFPVNKKGIISRLIKSCFIYGSFCEISDTSSQSFENKAEKFINSKLAELSSFNYTASLLLLLHEETEEDITCMTFESKYNQGINNVSEVEILKEMIKDWAVENSFEIMNHKASCKRIFCRTLL